MSARPVRPRATMKTYAHLAGARRVPTEYEIVTSELLYYIPRGGFEVKTPVSEWHERYQRGSALACGSWESFADPHATTYMSYVREQREKESFVSGLFGSIETSDYDASLSREWRATLVRTLFPMRYPWHALQMAAAYVGQLAPSGRVTIAALMQCANEVRRIQHVAYRIALMEREETGLAAASKAAWVTGPEWQPMRRTIEQLLVTYDWGEAFVALNLCVKPALDAVLRSLSDAAKRAGDYVLVEVLRSIDADVEWQRAWTKALVDLAVSDRADNRDVIEAWTRAWKPRADEAAGKLVAALAQSPGGARS